MVVEVFMNNVYLINGSIYHLVSFELDKIIKEDYNIVNINYNSNMREVLNEANYFSLDSSIKVIIVKNCDVFNSKNDDDSELLNKYLEDPNKSSILIFICDGVDSRKKIVKTIKEKYCYIELPKIDYKNIYTFITDYLNKYKYSIEFKASGYLVNVLGLNLDMIYNELDKLMLFYNKPCNIRLEDVENIVAKPLDNNSFHFIEACIQKNKSKALDIYRDLKIYKVEENMLIIMLYKEYKKMYFIKKYTKMHYDIKKISNELGLQPWQIERLYNSSLNYSEKELLNLIKKLGQIDLGLKSGLLDKNVVIYNFLYEIME